VTSSAENHDGKPTPPQLSSSAQSTEQPSKAILTLRPHKDDSDDLSEKENVQASPSSKGVPERGKYTAYSVAEKQAIVLEAKETGICVTAADKRIAGKLQYCLISLKQLEFPEFTTLTVIPETCFLNIRNHHITLLINRRNTFVTSNSRVVYVFIYYLPCRLKFLNAIKI